MRKSKYFFKKIVAMMLTGAILTTMVDCPRVVATEVTISDETSEVGGGATTATETPTTGTTTEGTTTTVTTSTGTSENITTTEQLGGEKPTEEATNEDSSEEEIAPTPAFNVTIKASEESLTWEYASDVTLTAEVDVDDNVADALSYQWYIVESENGEINKKNITDADKNTYIIETGLDAGEYTYGVQVTQGNSKTSAEYDITINPLELKADDLKFADDVITKKYDGTTSSDAKVQIKAGVVDAEPVKIAGTAEYNSANVGEATTVTFTPDSITDGNYRLSADVTISKSATITKAVNTTVPNEPEFVEIAATTITLVSYEGYEYYCEELELWQDSPTFTGLSPYTPYTFYQKIKEDANYESSQKTAGCGICTLKQSIENAIVTLDTTDYVYDGNPKTPSVSVMLDDKLLDSSKYTVEYYNNVDVGQATVTVLPTDVAYTGSISKEFTIKRAENPQEVLAPTVQNANITDTSITLDWVEGYEYYCAELGTWQDDPTFIGLRPGESYVFCQKIKESVNYNESAISDSVVIKTKVNIANADVSFDNYDNTFYQYDGNEKKPSVKIMWNNEIIDSTQYTVTYSNNIDAGDAIAWITATESGTCIGNTNLYFTINRGTNPNTPIAPSATAENITETSITLDEVPGYEYYCSAYGWQDSPTFIGLTPGVSYTFCQKIKEDANYSCSGDSSLAYIRTKLNLADTSGGFEYYDYSYYIYDGNEKQPQPYLYSIWNNETIDPSQYTVTYENNVNAGTATAIITANDTGYCFGSTSIKFTINRASNPNPLIIPSVEEVTETSVTLVEVGGYEYRMDFGEWQDSPTFSNLVPGTYYYFEQRIKENDIYLSSNISEGISIKTKLDFSNTYMDLDCYEYTYDGFEKTPQPNVHVISSGEYVDSSQYTVSYMNNVDAGQATVTITANESGDYVGSISKAFTIHPIPREYWPSAPTVSTENITETSITLDAVSGYEYYCWELGIWQDSPTFTGLMYGTSYTFSQREKATTNYEASYESSGTTIQTLKRSLETATITLDQYEFEYDGMYKYPNVTVELNGEIVASDQYSTYYYNNVLVGQATVVVSPYYYSSYTGSVSTEFTILRMKNTEIPYAPEASLRNITATSITLNELKGYEYCIEGGIWQDSPTFTGLEPNTTYTFYQRIKETDRVDNSVSSDGVSISTKKLLETADVTLEYYDCIYDGTEKKPEVTVTVNDELIDASQYTVAYYNNMNVGSASVDINAKDDGEYYGKFSKEFTILRGKAETPSAPTVRAANITETTITLDDAWGYEYRIEGGQWQATPTFTDLKGNTLYTFYRRMKETNNYEASESSEGLSVKTKQSIIAAVVKVDSGEYVYDKTEKQPGVTVTLNGEVIDASQYSIAYYNNVNAGKAKVTVLAATGGSYTGSASAEFTIVPKKLEVNVKAYDKTYDGKTDVGLLSTVDTGITGDTLRVTGLVGAFTSAEAGADKAVEIDSSAAIVTGNDKGNYTLVYPKEVTAAILKKKLSMKSAIVADKIYDGTTKASVTNVTLQGLVNGEKLAYGVDFNITDAQFDTPECGTNKAVTVKYSFIDTEKTQNYEAPEGEITSAAAITARSVTASNIKVKLSENAFDYDGSLKIPSVTVQHGTITMEEKKDYVVNVISTDGEGTSAGINVGKVTLQITGNGNYNGVVTKEYTINGAVITPVIEGTTTKAYDGKTDCDGKGLSIRLDGLVSGEDVKATATYTYENESAGENKKVIATDIAITGSDVANYKLGVTKTEASVGTITKIPATLTLKEGFENYSKNEEDSEFVLEGISYDGDGALVYTVSNSMQITNNANGEVNSGNVANDKVIKVDNKGKVTIVGSGIATISVTATEGINYGAVNGGNAKIITVQIKKKQEVNNSPTTEDDGSSSDKPNNGDGQQNQNKPSGEDDEQNQDIQTGGTTQPGQDNQDGGTTQPGQDNQTGEGTQPGQDNQGGEGTQPDQDNQGGEGTQPGQNNQTGGTTQPGQDNQGGEGTQPGQNNQTGGTTQPGQNNQNGGMQQPNQDELDDGQDSEDFDDGMYQPNQNMPIVNGNQQSQGIPSVDNNQTDASQDDDFTDEELTDEELMDEDLVDEEMFEDVDTVTDDGYTAEYIITNSKEDQEAVEYVAPIDAEISEILIPASVTIEGVTYKVTSIAKDAFSDNDDITAVVIGSNIKTIGAKAFNDCSELETVVIGKNVDTINDKAFYKCTSLTEVTIPSKVSKIGKQTFYGCKKLKKITIKTKKLTSKKVGSKAFKNIYKNVTIKVPKNKLKSYKTMLKSKGVGNNVKFTK